MWAVVLAPSPPGQVTPAVPKQNHNVKHVAWHLEAGFPLQNGADNHLYLCVTMEVCMWGCGGGVGCHAWRMAAPSSLSPGSRSLWAQTLPGLPFSIQ